MGPILMGRIAMQERQHLRSQGYGFFKINQLMENFDATAVHAAVAEADMVKPGCAAAFYKVAAIEPPVAGVEPDVDPAKPPKVRAFGDGQILQKLIDAWKQFSSSELGKAIIAALEKILIGFLVV